MKPTHSGSGSRSGSLVDLTVALTAAYVSRNAVALADLPTAIRYIYESLLTLRTGTAPDLNRSFRSGSEISASIRHDFIVSFIDGREYKSIKRHLAAHGMTPEDYRRRYGLPSDYPLVSPGYAMTRSSIAKQIYHRYKAD